MPNVSVAGDTFIHGSGTGTLAPSQSFVTVNGKPVHTTGDVSVPHSTSSTVDVHVGTATGSGFVTINGKNVALVGDSLSCGGTIVGPGEFPTVN